MKWKEAYRCKICGKIHHHKRDTYCKQCGAKISYPNPHYSSSVVPPCRFATENLEPVIVRRVIFGWDVRPSSMSSWLIQGNPPPKKNIMIN